MRCSVNQELTNKKALVSEMYINMRYMSVQHNMFFSTDFQNSWTEQLIIERWVTVDIQPKLYNYKVLLVKILSIVYRDYSMREMSDPPKPMCYSKFVITIKYMGHLTFIGTRISKVMFVFQGTSSSLSRTLLLGLRVVVLLLIQPHSTTAATSTTRTIILRLNIL